MARGTDATTKPLTPVFGVDTPLSAYETHGGKAEWCRGRRSGVHVKFENGWVVSIQWGPGTYSSNHTNLDLLYRDDPAPDAVTAEVACWRGEVGDMLRWADGDSVSGWHSWEQVQQLIAAAAADSLTEPIDLFRGGDEQ